VSPALVCVAATLTIVALAGWELDWRSRLSPAMIIDGGDGVIHVFYDSIARSIVLFSVNPYA
jgi:hypothetical protein